MWFKIFALNPQIFNFFSLEEINCLFKFITLSRFKKVYLLSTNFSSGEVDFQIIKKLSNILADSGIGMEILTKKEVKAKKGSKLWIKKIEEKENVSPTQILFLGRHDNPYDYFTAINRGALFCCIAKRRLCEEIRKYSLYLSDVKKLNLISRIFKGDTPLYTYKLDFNNVHYRGLVNRSTQFKSDDGTLFSVYEIFKDENAIRDKTIWKIKVEGILFLFLVAQLWKEGVITRNTIICVYPSHLSQKIPSESKLGKYLDLFKGFFGCYYRDLLIRIKNTEDKSICRMRGDYHRISFRKECETLGINKEVREKLEGKTIIVVDDFSTTGMSLEAARIKLLESGAREVYGISVGKYGIDYTIFDKEGNEIEKQALERDVKSESLIISILNPENFLFSF
ncbi:hypothetical protein DRN73_08625 [Candidatus Pacearchaeota archaeon]|nr:MAG: hypothetical protein DRN73_08625 [Candidatus Pacearchaeota archaeon]